MAKKVSIKLFWHYIKPSEGTDRTDELEINMNQWLLENNVAIHKVDAKVMDNDCILMIIQYFELPKRELITEKEG